MQRKFAAGRTIAQRGFFISIRQGVARRRPASLRKRLSTVHGVVFAVFVLDGRHSTCRTPPGGSSAIALKGTELEALKRQCCDAAHQVLLDRGIDKISSHVRDGT
ncbi:hypothetical protein [Bradyrhizobium zhanjiangense]|uniref:hypothetical protein n=1 Tax=Bradyrhizobium zhanjiangense TaxID=1325107 RepID=UPI0019D6FD3C|nr:hypothetical protein [Bradyrhizobium zhanjiangense]